MDQDTLLAHRLYWDEESEPTRQALEHLTAEEAAVYDDLRYDRHQLQAAPEQERIGFRWVCDRLACLLNSPRSTAPGCVSSRSGGALGQRCAINHNTPAPILGLGVLCGFRVPGGLLCCATSACHVEHKQHELARSLRCCAIFCRNLCRLLHRSTRSQCCSSTTCEGANKLDGFRGNSNPESIAGNTAAARQRRAACMGSVVVGRQKNSIAIINFNVFSNGQSPVRSRS